jgi:predicted nucleic acid-binding protein
LITPAVASEIAPSLPILPSWIVVERLKREPHAATLSPSLGQGEREVISLAIEIGGGRVIVDDQSARRVAKRIGLHVIGTAGILIAAKRRGIIPKVKPYLDRLLAVEFFLSPELYDEVIHRAGE